MAAGGIAVALVALVVVIATGAGDTSEPTDESIRGRASAVSSVPTVGGDSLSTLAGSNPTPDSALAASNPGISRVVVEPDPNFQEALERAPFSSLLHGDQGEYERVK